MLDHLHWETPAFKVQARIGACGAAQVRLAEAEEVAQQLSSAIPRLHSLDLCDLDSGSGRELLDYRSEGLTTRHDAAVDVSGPESGVATVDEKPRRRGAVSNDPIGADAEHAVGCLLVRRDPAASILPPAELGERAVETSRKSGQNNLNVEVPDSLL